MGRTTSDNDDLMNALVPSYGYVSPPGATWVATLSLNDVCRSPTILGKSISLVFNTTGHTHHLICHLQTLTDHFYIVSWLLLSFYTQS